MSHGPECLYNGSCHGADLARDHNPAIPPPYPRTWTTTSSYLGPNPGSQTHPQDVRTDVSSSWNLDIQTLLDPDVGHPALLWILTGSPVTLVSMITAVTSPPSLAVIHHLPSPQFMSPCLQTAYRIPTAHVSRPLGSWTHLLMDFLPSPFLSFCILLLSNSL
jgi:hypothetical protein